MSRRVWIRGVAAALGVFFVAPGSLHVAAAATHPHPRLLRVRVSRAHTTLPATGARVRMTVRVRNANRCVFLRQTGTSSALHVFRTRSCRRGRAKVTFPAIRNSSLSVVRLRYAVRAIGPGHRRAQRKVVLREAAALPAGLTASLSLSPASLPATGGPVTAIYSSSNATSCSLSSTPSLWSGSNPLPVSCKGRTTLPSQPPAVSTRQWTLTFTADGAGGKVETATRTLVEGTSTFTPSANWSGYVVPSSSVVTSVSGRFTVPTLNCSHTPNAGESTWVGTGGAGGTTGDLLQTGVRSDCVGGTQHDDPAWWEEAPEYPEIDFQTISVSPGDQIEASVYEESDGVTWVTRLDDLSTGISGVMITGGAYGTILDSNTGTWRTVEGSTASVSYSGGYTAEWIVEDYYSVGLSGEVPLADFGTVAFSGLTTSLPTWDLTPAEEVGIVQNGVTLAVPSPPASGGFSVSFSG